MNKVKMIEELIRTRDSDLMLGALWEDEDIVNKVKANLMATSKNNLEYYVNHFIGDMVTRQPKAIQHRQVFRDDGNTAEYIRHTHGIVA